MAKFKISPRVISVCFKGKVYQKKDKVVFDEEKHGKAEINAAYKSGFLVKVSGKKEITWKQENEQLEKASAELKNKKQAQLNKIKALKKELLAIEGQLDEAEGQKKEELNKLAEEKTVEIKLAEEELK